MPIIKIEPIPEPNCLSCVNHKEFSGEDFFEVYCQKLYEQEPPYPVCVEYDKQVVFNVDAAIEEIAAKVHEGWMNEKLAQGFADHPWVTEADSLADGWYECLTCKGKYPPHAHRSDMLPYADLPEHIKEYDRKTAHMVFEWLTENGWQVVAKEEA